MNKLWAEKYFVLSSLVILLLTAGFSLTLVSENISQAESKYVFESIYKDTSIDFIVPGPGYDQITEIEGNEAAGVEVMTPYYETSTSVSINGISVSNGNVLIFPDAAKAEYTPYAASRIIKGEKSINIGSAVVDSVYADANNCGLGDEIQIVIAGQTYRFTVTGITPSNTYHKEGSIAVFIDEAQTAALKEAGITYSASYVSASDYEACKNYLFNEYKPLGRLKDKTEFDSDDIYNRHVQNFNDADWSKEITNCRANYDEMKVKYANVASGIWCNIAIYAAAAFLLVVILNNMLLRDETIRQFMRTFLVKKGGTKAEIAAFYTKGIIYDLVLFVIACTAGYIIAARKLSSSPTGDSLLNAAIPILAFILASVIMMSVTKSFVMKNYALPKAEKSETDSVE